jgi:hypothetical protein
MTENKGEADQTYKPLDFIMGGDEKTKWIRYADQKPPLLERVLVLVTSSPAKRKAL